MRLWSMMRCLGSFGRDPSNSSGNRDVTIYFLSSRLFISIPRSCANTLLSVTTSG
jgi:hypothetical protein